MSASNVGHPALLKRPMCPVLRKFMYQLAILVNSRQSSPISSNKREKNMPTAKKPFKILNTSSFRNCNYKPSLESWPSDERIKILKIDSDLD